jgi:hypothetical protein
MHRHWCSVEGHWYDCGESCVCECGRSMDEHDHSQCPVELRPCAEHPVSVQSEATGELPSWFPTEEDRQKHQRKHQILKQLVFYDLSFFNENPDGDRADFLEADFFKAVARCEILGVTIHGIDLFSTENGYLGTEYPPEGSQGLTWCRESLKRCLGRSDVVFCATYGVPDEWLDVF